MTATSVFYLECQIAGAVLISPVTKIKNSHKHVLIITDCFMYLNYQLGVSGVQPSTPLFTHNLGLPPPALFVVAQPFPCPTVEGNGEGEEVVGNESEMNITHHF